jgi:hypothetical protein
MPAGEGKRGREGDTQDVTAGPRLIKGVDQPRVNEKRAHSFSTANGGEGQVNRAGWHTQRVNP